MMKAFLTKAWTAITNPGQDERVAQIVVAIGNGFRVRKQKSGRRVRPTLSWSIAEAARSREAGHQCIATRRSVLC